MVVKNKLYKHHKNKFVLAMRNFSISIASLLAVIAIVAIPTYIKGNVRAEAESSADIQQVKENETNNEEETELETYEEK